MIETEISKVLSQMRELSTELRTGTTAPAPTIGGTGGTQFNDVLRNAIDSVSEQQAAAGPVAGHPLRERRARRQHRRGDGLDAEGEPFLPGDERGPQPAGGCLPAGHEHADLSGRLSPRRHDR